MTDYPTTETTFGPAQYTVSADGSVHLTWPEGFTLNRVRYVRASVHGEVRDSGRHTGHVNLQREHWRDEPTNSARAAVSREHARLAPVLATPEAIARAQLVRATDALKYAERDRIAAQDKEAQARAALAQAQLQLTQLQAGLTPA